MHAIVYLALTWIRYFTQKMFSPQEKIIVEFIKMTPFKSLHTLDTVLLPEWSTAVFISLVIVVHESLVCPEQLNCLLFFRKTLQLSLILWFSSIFVYLNPFQQWLYDFEIHLFTPRTTERLITTITEDSNTHRCSRRRNHVLRAGAWKLLNRMKMCIFFLFCLNIIFFYFALPFRSYRR